MEDKIQFKSLNIKPSIVNALSEHGFIYTSEIQHKVIPLLLKRKSVIGLSVTGSGKTLSYLIPILNDLENNGHVQAIIITPTVALQSQIRNVFQSFTSKLNYSDDCVKTIYSNADFNMAKPLIVIVTPQMYKNISSHYPIDQLKRVIIDEGDMITFDGFSSSLNDLKKAKEKKIISFFSASLNQQQIKKVKTMFNIDCVCNCNTKINSDEIKHHLIDIKNNSKGIALDKILNNLNVNKCIAFASTKDELYKISNELKTLNRKHILIEGGMNKREIDQGINEFKNNPFSLLLTTDYLSRGLDIDNIDCIISCDLSSDSQYYFHRAGRSGRFFTSGDSYILFSYDDKESVKKVKDLIRRGVNFDIYSLSNDILKKNKDPYNFKQMGIKDRIDNKNLQKQIRHIVNKTKTGEVKPGYKKKVSKAVKQVKDKHRKKIVLTNITKKGGNNRDFH